MLTKKDFMVRLFKRKHNLEENIELPEEVREYYASTKKRRFGVAFLLGFMGILVVLAFSFGIYTMINSIFSSYDEVAKQTAENNSQPQEKPDSNVDNAPDTNIPEQPAQTEPPKEEPKEKPKEKPKEQPKKTVAKTNNSSTVPETGPGQTLALFSATVVIGILISQIYQRRTISE